MQVRHWKKVSHVVAGPIPGVLPVPDRDPAPAPGNSRDLAGPNPGE